ncbi:hypothetical protein IAT38_007698 [Cryptococcus sp. DSM 104549]
MPRDKGKGKAVDQGERTPLLASSSRTSSRPPPDSGEALATPRPPRTRTALLALSTILLSLFLSFLLFLALLFSSFKPSPSELNTLPSTAFEYTVPSHVSVLNITDSGVLLNITLRCGIDADRALGVQGWYAEEDQRDAIARGERGGGAAWWEGLRRWTAHRMVRSLPRQEMLVDIPDAIYIFPHHFTSPPLLTLSFPEPLLLPLVTGVAPSHPAHPDRSWLRPLTFVALARPIASTGEIWEFIRRGWAEGNVRVVVGANRVEVGLGGGQGTWWGKWLEMRKEDLVLDLGLPIPHLPGLPHPGHPLNLSSLVTLQHYTFGSEAEDLTIAATATMPNFAREFTRGANFTVPFGMPFSISLPDVGGDSKMAEVVLEPVTVGDGKEIVLNMGGVITADLEGQSSLFSNDTTRTSPLSLFLQNYLHGLPSPILIRGLPHFPSLPPSSHPAPPPPPSWILSTLPSLTVPLLFPGPSPPPQIIKHVTIEKMSISEEDGRMKASGVVVAEVELPRDMWGVEVEVVAVKPDVLVFDGAAPDDFQGPDSGDDDGGDDGEDYPPRAFGHIHPPTYLPSTTSPSPSPDTPHRLIVRAPLSNVDLDILPGRDSVLSDFVTKVVFKGGALAGVKGTADVKVEVKGVRGTVGVEGLPVKGEFWVGKQRG